MDRRAAHSRSSGCSQAHSDRAATRSSCCSYYRTPTGTAEVRPAVAYGRMTAAGSSEGVVRSLPSRFKSSTGLEWRVLNVYVECDYLIARALWSESRLSASDMEGHEIHAVRLEERRATRVLSGSIRCARASNLTTKVTAVIALRCGVRSNPFTSQLQCQ